MREILFRGKKKDNGEWVEGFYSNGLYANKHYISKWYYGSYAELQRFEVMPETIGQYTGLTDNNGVKIFEGDIVMLGLFPYVVKYDTENARFMFYNKNGILQNGFNADTMATKKIVGNIHDNPELMPQSYTTQHF